MSDVPRFSQASALGVAVGSLLPVPVGSWDGCRRTLLIPAFASAVCCVRLSSHTAAGVDANKRLDVPFCRTPRCFLPVLPQHSRTMCPFPTCDPIGIFFVSCFMCVSVCVCEVRSRSLFGCLCRCGSLSAQTLCIALSALKFEKLLRPLGWSNTRGSFQTGLPSMSCNVLVCPPCAV